MSRLRANIGRGLAVVAGLVAGSALVVPALAGDAPTQLPAGTGNRQVSVEAPPTYPTNERGQTFGSASLARSVDEEPDLIEVIATNGRVGYALREELNGEPLPASPEEAVARTEAELADLSPPEAIDVFAVDGTTVIGEFEFYERTPESSGHTDDPAEIERLSPKDD